MAKFTYRIELINCKCFRKGNSLKNSTKNNHKRVDAVRSLSRGTAATLVTYHENFPSLLVDFLQ